ncbi:hypothetical protein SAMN06296386_10936 [Lachnospiraceae bacterium]|nr:hypothetical protein SAMN06296386_10936 [Lachnospiraceae bacterium]
MATRRTGYQFTCGRADTKINAWLSSPLNTCKSHLAREAIEHYVSTGRYYLIGMINEPDLGSLKYGKVCNISIPQNSEFERWYLSELEKGRSIAPFVKKILYNSIIYTNGEEYIPSKYDDLTEIDEKIKTSAEKRTKIEKKEVRVEQETIPIIRKEKKKNTAFEQLLKPSLDKGFGFED